MAACFFLTGQLLEFTSAERVWFKGAGKWLKMKGFWGESQFPRINCLEITLLPKSSRNFSSRIFGCRTFFSPIFGSRILFFMNFWLEIFFHKSLAPEFFLTNFRLQNFFSPAILGSRNFFSYEFFILEVFPHGFSASQFFFSRNFWLQNFFSWCKLFSNWCTFLSRLYRHCCLSKPNPINSVTFQT